MNVVVYRLILCHTTGEEILSSFSIQFHAIIDDIERFCALWMRDCQMFVTAVQYQPFAVTLVTAEQLPRLLMDDRIARIMFTEVAPDLNVGGNNELLDKNGTSLLLDIGRLGPRGLEESRLSTKDAVPQWRKIAASLRRGTAAGALGTHEQTGAHAYYRQHRYTPAAKALSESGTAMRPFPQSPVRFTFGPEPPEATRCS